MFAVDFFLTCLKSLSDEVGPLTPKIRTMCVSQCYLTQSFLGFFWVFFYPSIKVSKLHELLILFQSLGSNRDERYTLPIGQYKIINICLLSKDLVL